jgi:signal peptidase I
MTQPPSNPQSPWRDVVQTMLLSLVLAGGARQVLAEPRYIPTASMEPTLEINDRLLVDKVSYRFHEPMRGDMIVFNPPAALETQMKDAFIKRIIAVPGETVEVKSGTVYINQKPIVESYIKEKPNYEMAAIVVPADQFFVLGDNRNNSYDSHYWGFVPREKIIGRAMVRTWPMNRIGNLN